VMIKRDDGRAPSAAHDPTLSAAVCSIEPTN
jgi:hypothetical protein